MLKLSVDRVGEILTLQQTLVLADIVRAAQQKHKVMWIENEGDAPTEGVVRSIGDVHGNFLNADDDIRDAYLRITAGGWEHFMPIKQVMTLVGRFYMVFDPD